MPDTIATNKREVSDARLRAMIQFYSRNWPDGELARALQELEERRTQDGKLPDVKGRGE